MHQQSSGCTVDIVDQVDNIGGDPPEGTWAPYQSQKETCTPNVISGMIWKVHYFSFTVHLDGREWANVQEFGKSSSRIWVGNPKKTVSKT